MENFNLPFVLRQDYETWEFELEVLDIERVPNYDSYLYIGEAKEFLNQKPNKAELIFYWDRLEAVILTFFHIGIDAIEEIKNTLKCKYSLASYEVHLNYDLYEYYAGEIQLFLVLKKANSLFVIYGNSSSLEEIKSNVLEEISD
ncbi:hypothetical protein MPN29_03260 [Riemerella anatipestifer]|uniref:hypothetical protein n=1 Tax=Riemerella anatipestifer TaxID=34085 RepID=UPI0007EC51F5|nr:hypothetical protein [Riemerella anatipestifer]MDD1549868.1 hypothetical protein [Riemerella anatipestifer]MDR7832496.1 hypothetical protein [Riemerella anatipestifer]OBP62348.1 hypothetical protein AWB84_08680 [Riemerella anatipestifer]QZO83862.1 hypothetical protein K6T40_03330 [Riemerella anatipestifer]WKV54730.1 hypothetical protein MPN29_03260 [Riemerella anatipestifer]